MVLEVGQHDYTNEDLTLSGRSLFIHALSELQPFFYSTTMTWIKVLQEHSSGI